MPITFKLEPDGTQWHAFCPELKGCHTFGATKEEALANLKDAVNLYKEPSNKHAQTQTQNHRDQ